MINSYDQKKVRKPVVQVTAGWNDRDWNENPSSSVFLYHHILSLLLVLFASLTHHLLPPLLCYWIPLHSLSLTILLLWGEEIEEWGVERVCEMMWDGVLVGVCQRLGQGMCMVRRCTCISLCISTECVYIVHNDRVCMKSIDRVCQGGCNLITCKIKRILRISPPRCSWQPLSWS